MPRIPVTLRQDTIIEALFEIRFRSKTKALASLLPGLMFKDVGSEFPALENLPITNLSPAVLQNDPALQFAPQHKMSGQQYSILIGDRVFTVSCPRPYVGWKDFSSTIHKLVKIVRSTALIDVVERFSIKYINLVPHGDVRSSYLDKLRVNFSVGNYDLKDKPVQLRSEINIEGFINIIQMASSATIELASGEKLEGVLFDIDTIYQAEFKDFWNEIPQLLEKAHNVEKSIFFGTLSEDTLNSLGPVWE